MLVPPRNARPLARAALCLGLFVAGPPLTSCADGEDGACSTAAECGAVGAAPCERCPGLPASLCLDGACVPRPADEVDVRVTLVIDRAIGEGARGLAWAVAAADRTCDDVGSFEAFPADLNALSAGQKSLSGGAFHPDVGLARVPAGEILVLALATDEAAAAGSILGHGCAQATATAPELSVERLDIAP